MTATQNDTPNVQTDELEAKMIDYMIAHEKVSAKEFQNWWESRSPLLDTDFSNIWDVESSVRKRRGTTARGLLKAKMNPQEQKNEIS